MSTEVFKKTEHYVPTSYLKFFGNKKTNTYFTFCYFKNTNTIKEIDIQKICAVNDLYELKLDDEYVERNVIENGFVRIEGEYSDIINSILSRINNQGEIVLRTEEVYVLKTFIYLLLFRSKKFVEAAAKRGLETAKSLNLANGELRNVFGDVDDETFMAEYLPCFEEEIGYRSAHQFLKMCLDVNAPNPLHRLVIDRLGLYYCFLYDKTGSFITSDFPVVDMYNESADPCEEYDILCMPISPNACIVLFDEDEKCNQKVIELNEAQVRYINNYRIVLQHDYVLSNDMKKLENLI